MPLSTEWEFCQDYIYLMGQRFNGLFPVQNNLNPELAEQYFIPPASVQTLLENITKHNVALPQNPVHTEIRIADDYLIMSNEYQPKAQVQDSTGTGLHNLAARIALLTDKKLEYEVQNGHFIVRLPLVKQI